MRAKQFIFIIIKVLEYEQMQVPELEHKNYIWIQNALTKI